MSLSPSRDSNSASSSFEEILGLPDADMKPYTPGQCLFCTKSQPTFPGSVTHMQKSHGLFVPDQQYLAVDLETLFEYLHLIIFGYRECIQCGTERSTVQAVQQHMTGKGHCRFDVAGQDSEYAVFYDYYDLGDDAEQVDDDSIRLPSGKIISKRSPTQPLASLTQMRRRAQNQPAQIEYTFGQSDTEEASSSDEPGQGVNNTRALSKREKREKAAASHQLASMSQNDRTNLMHLPSSEQRAILATQFREMERSKKKERRRQGKIDRKGNKNLYAYWHTETPVYTCG